MEIDFHTLQADVDTLALFTEWGKLMAFVIEQVRLKNPSFMDDTTLSNGESKVYYYSFDYFFITHYN